MIQAEWTLSLWRDFILHCHKDLPPSDWKPCEIECSSLTALFQVFDLEISVPVLEENPTVTLGPTGELKPISRVVVISSKTDFSSDPPVSTVTPTVNSNSTESPPKESGTALTHSP